MRSQLIGVSGSSQPENVFVSTDVHNIVACLVIQLWHRSCHVEQWEPRRIQIVDIHQREPTLAHFCHMETLLNILIVSHYTNGWLGSSLNIHSFNSKFFADEIHEWFTRNRLWLNLDKIQLMYSFSAKFIDTFRYSYLSINSVAITATDHVRDLIVLYSDLLMCDQINVSSVL